MARGASVTTPTLVDAQERRILLVDGNNLLHRVCHIPAFHELRTVGGLQAGGMFGFLKSLRKSLDMSIFVRCIVAWDSTKSKSKRRLRLFPEYKDRSNRPDNRAPEKLREKAEYMKFFDAQRSLLSGMLSSLGVDEIELPGREGDDVLFWVRENMKFLSKDQWHRCVILSEDLDFMQLIDDQTDLYRPIQDQYISLANFTSIHGVTPARFLLYKAILGDKSDCVPGIRGVGPAAALDIANAVMVDEAISSMFTPWSWSEVREYCATSSSRRLQSVAENLETVRRNFLLFNLLEETPSDGDIQEISDLVHRSSARDLRAALLHLEKVEFVEITSDYASWSIPFRRLG